MPRAPETRVLLLVFLFATVACDVDRRTPLGEQTASPRQVDDEGKLGKRAAEAIREAPAEPKQPAAVADKSTAHASRKADEKARAGGGERGAPGASQALGDKKLSGKMSGLIGARGNGLGSSGHGIGGGGTVLGKGGLGSGTSLGQAVGGLRGAFYGKASGSGGHGVGYGAGRASVTTGVASTAPSVPPPPGGNFVHAGTNDVVAASEDEQSTFAIDVDTGSFTFARAFLQSGSRPPASSVRVEEWINAHHYGYEGPREGEGAFRIHLAAGPSPFSGGKHLLRVALQGKRVSEADRKATHLTFLVDVSGSMQAPDKLPLVRESLHLLVNQLRGDDSVALVTYAGATKLVLPATSAADKRAIHAAIDQLTPGGGTAMGSGMELAYRQAALQLSDEKLSRVLVLSDGDANIGRTSHEGILQAVRGWVSEGVTLSTVGFGRGNYNDHLMEGLADAGNGNYTYLDSKDAAQRFFRQDLVAMLQVIAQDVKVQVEMNPEVVRGYRLIGYENRDVADKDFANDKVDGGEIGAGHAVTALYELDLKEGADGDVATVHVRAKEPRGLRSRETVASISRADVQGRFEDLDDDARFAAGVALTAELLRGSPHVRQLSLADAEAIVSRALGEAHAKERRDFVALVRKLVAAESALARR